MIHISSSRFRTTAAAILAISAVSLLSACAGVRSTNTSGVSGSGVQAYGLADISVGSSRSTGYSRSGLSSHQSHIGIGGEMEYSVASGHRRSHFLQVLRVAFHQRESRIG